MRGKQAIRSTLALLVIALTASTGRAQVSGTWTLDAAGSYSVGANWSSNPNPPGAGGVATFGGAITAARIITIDASPVLSGLVFSNQSSSGAYTLTVSGGNFFDMTAGATITNTSPVNLGTSNIPFQLQGNLTFGGGGFGTNVFSGIWSNQGGNVGSLTINNPGILNQDLGFLNLQGANTFTGGVNLLAGTLRLGNASAMGTGTVTFNGGNLSASTAALTYANAVDVTNASFNWLGTNSGTFSGVISGLGGFGVVNQSRNNTLTLTGANTYNGPTVVRRQDFDSSNGPAIASTTTFSGANGSAVSSSSYDIQGGGAIFLTNNIAASISRINTSAPINIGTGRFQATGGTGAGAPFTQNAGNLTATGLATVEVGVSGAATEGFTLNFNNVNRGVNNTGTYIFNGSSATFGTAAAGAGISRMTFTTPPTLTGGALGTPAAGVIPFAIGGTTLGGIGTQLVTYDTNGVRLLTAAEQTLNAFTAGTNVDITAAQVNNATVAINSLRVGAAITGTGTLQITSGIILGNVTAAITNNIDFGTTQGNIFATANTPNFLGRITGSGGLVKSGAGAAFIAPYNTYTGTTAINRGYVLLTDQSAFGTSTSPIEFTTTGARNVNGLTITNLAPGLAVNFSRNINNNGGFLSFQGNTSATQAYSTFIASGVIAGDGGVSFEGVSGTAGLGSSMTFLAGNNTYTGPTRLFSGHFAIGSDANLGANVPTAWVELGASGANGMFLFGNWTTSRYINSAFSTGLFTNGFDATWNGQYTGGSQLAKYDDGTLNIANSGASSFSSNLFVDGGTVTLSGNTQLTRAVTGVASGMFRIDNTGTAVNQRLGAQSNISFTNQGGGIYQFDSGTNTYTQNFSAVSVGSGGSAFGRINMTAGTGGGVQLRATSATAGYLVVNSPAFFLSGTGLVNDSVSATPGQTSLVFVTAPTQVNGQLSGLGAAGTNTVGILRGAAGQRTGTGSAFGLLTQTSTTVGARLLDEANEYAINTQVADANTLINAAAPTFAAGSINSAYVRGSNNLQIASGSTLNVASGTFLSHGGVNAVRGDGPNGGGATLTSSTFNAIASGFVFHVMDEQLTLNANLNFASVAGSRLIKAGPGTLVYDPRDAAGIPIAPLNAGSADTRVLEGTFNIPAGQTIANVPGNLILSNSARIEYFGTPAATTKTLALVGSGGTLNLTGTSLQFTGTSATLTNGGVNGLGGALRLAGGTLILGNGTAGVPGVSQPNTYELGTYLNGGTLAINANSTVGSAGVLGAGHLRLNGGQLAPKFSDRAVTVPVEVNANTTFVNNISEGGADASNGGLIFSGPIRLEGNFAFNNTMTGNAGTGVGGVLQINSSIYDNPYKPAASITFNNTVTAGRTVLNGNSVHRGGTIIGSGTVQINNNVAGVPGSATGTGNVTVNAGARMMGGNAAGSVGFIIPASGGTVNVQGTLQPGTGLATPGIMTMGAPDRTVALSFAAVTSNFVFDLAATNVGSPTLLNDGSSTVAAGTSNNFLRMLGNGGSLLDFQPANFTINSIAALPNWNQNDFYSWQVGSVTGGTAIAGNPIFDISNFNNPIGPMAFFSLSQVGNNVFLNYTPVPEPATVLGICAFGFGAVRVIRRRFKKTTTAV